MSRLHLKSGSASETLDRQFQRALSLCSSGNRQGAKELCQQIIRSAPRHADATHLQALIAIEEKAFPLALALLNKVIRVDPGYAAAYVNRGAVCRQLGRLEASLESCNRAIEIDSGLLAAHFDRAVVLRQLGRHSESMQSFDRVLSLHPDSAEARFARSMLLLLLGYFREGWEEYEWRFRSSQMFSARALGARRWRGEDVTGKTVLVYAEQGLGDTLQFCRYIPLLSQRGARVILEVQEPLRELLSDMEGVTELVATNSVDLEFDFDCPLLSLPLVLALTVNEGSIPANTPYVQADSTRVTEWQGRLGQQVRPRIGLAWSGNPLHVNDPMRSIPLEILLRYLPRNFDYVVLQTDIRPADLAALRANRELMDLSGQLTDYSETAAVCGCLNLVISVDTSVAHLCGALALPTWLLLPTDPDWRWQLQRDDSPWYPGMKLYRQENPGDWKPVLKRVAGDVNRLFYP